MQILFEDHHLIAANKPAPLLTQAPAGIPSLEAMVKQYIKEKYNKAAGVYLGIPHRLDRPVSGVVLFARNSKAAARVAEQFQRHTVEKSYTALVEGNVAAETGDWIDYIRKVDNESRAELAEEGAEGAREALTRFRVVKRLEGTTMLEMTPRTGRMHQLRIQCSLRGHPVAGDVLYGSSRAFGPAVEHGRDRAIALHAHRLVLVHPFRKEPLTIEAPLPKIWSDFPTWDKSLTCPQAS